MLRLKEVLKEKGMTGKELSGLVMVTPASISNIVNGNHFPKPELLKDIANVLNIDIRELFEATKPAQQTESIYIKRDEKYLKIGTVNILELTKPGTNS